MDCSQLLAGFLYIISVPRKDLIKHICRREEHKMPQSSATGEQ